MQLSDAVVLVTGASAGIGRAAATRFAAQGARVLVHGRDPDRTAAVARAIGGRALPADLAIAPERQRLAAEALDAFGRVDALVNNAGFGYSGPLTAMSVEEISIRNGFDGGRPLSRTSVSTESWSTAPPKP